MQYDPLKNTIYLKNYLLQDIYSNTRCTNIKKKYNVYVLQVLILAYFINNISLYFIYSVLKPFASEKCNQTPFGKISVLKSSESIFFDDWNLISGWLRFPDLVVLPVLDSINCTMASYDHSKQVCWLGPAAHSLLCERILAFI